MIAWTVYLRGKEIDTVWFTPDFDEEYVLSTLINYDGYDPEISVCRESE